MSGPRLAALVLAALAAAPLAAAEERVLVLAFDAVPYETVRRLTAPERGDEALFAGLAGPAPLVSTFPSTTSVAFGGMLASFGLDISPGYEARFFDWERRRVRGGGPLSYFKIDFAWRDFFHWNRKSPARRMLASLHPLRSSLAWFERGIRAFERSDEPLFFVYNGATDSLAHLQGPDAFAAVFAALEERLAESRRRRPFRLVMLSDHGIAGGEPLRNVWRPARRALRASGFRTRKRLRRPGDVALTPFGLVSSFEAYTGPAEREPVARVLAAVEGVDLCVVRLDADRWRVFDARGEADFARRAGKVGSEWRYRTGSSDPLGYAELTDGGAWQPDDGWFSATAGHRFPDALYRLATSFELVENPASILCSVAPGWMYGAVKTERGARLTGERLRWTHGALHRDATLGFVLGDLPGLERGRALRFDRALEGLTAER